MKVDDGDLHAELLEGKVRVWRDEHDGVLVLAPSELRWLIVVAGAALLAQFPDRGVSRDGAG